MGEATFARTDGNGRDAPKAAACATPSGPTLFHFTEDLDVALIKGQVGGAPPCAGEVTTEESVILALYIAAAVVDAVGTLYFAW